MDEFWWNKSELEGDSMIQKIEMTVAARFNFFAFNVTSQLVLSNAKDRVR